MNKSLAATWAGMVFPGWGAWSDRKAHPVPLEPQLQRDAVQGFPKPYEKPYAKPYFQFAAIWSSLLQDNNFSQCLLELDLLRGHVGRNPRNPNVPLAAPPPMVLLSPEEAALVPPGEGTLGTGLLEAGLLVQASQAPPLDVEAVGQLPDEALEVRVPDQAMALRLPDQARAVSSRDRLVFAIRHGRVREAGLLVVALPQGGSAKGWQNLNEGDARRNSDSARDGQNFEAGEDGQNFREAEAGQNVREAEDGLNADAGAEGQVSRTSEEGLTAHGLASLVAEMAAKAWFTELSR